MKKGLFEFNVRDIVEIAIFCALAIVLDTFVKIPLGPSGSINLSMVPILVIALRHGWFKGFVAGGIIFGFISGIKSLIYNSSIIHIQYNSFSRMYNSL